MLSCAACAKPAPPLNCARCKTAYCSASCQKTDWKAAHKKICKQIANAGGALQFDADAKAKVAADAAIAECAGGELADVDEPCYICGDDDRAGLVRGCSCRGTAGVAHLKCLVAQARVAHEEQEDNGLERWHTCKLCGQRLHGSVFLAMTRACWKTYVKEDECDARRLNALNLLAPALRQNGFLEEALGTAKMALAALRRCAPNAKENIGAIMHNIRNIELQMVVNLKASEPKAPDTRAGRNWEDTPSVSNMIGADQLQLARDTYARDRAKHGPEHVDSLTSALRLLELMRAQDQLGQARRLLREQIPYAEKVFGAEDLTTLMLSFSLLQVLEGQTMWMMVADPEENIEADAREAAALTERLSKVMVRVLGRSHPQTKDLLFRIGMYAKARRAYQDPSFLQQQRRAFKQQFAGPAGEKLVEFTKRDFANSRMDPSQHWPYFEAAEPAEPR
jgi:hypothetical protein